MCSCFPSPAPPTDPIMTPASTPLSTSGLGTLGAMTGDLVGGDEELQRERRERKGRDEQRGEMKKFDRKRDVRRNRTAQRANTSTRNTISSFMPRINVIRQDCPV